MVREWLEERRRKDGITAASVVVYITPNWCNRIAKMHKGQMMRTA
jgi:hypothetical protein